MTLTLSQWTALLTALCGAFGTIAGFLHGAQLWRWFVDRRELIAVINVLSTAKAALERDLSTTRASLDIATKFGAFSGDQLTEWMARNEELYRRVDELERRQGEADAYIRGAVPYMAALETIVVSSQLPLPTIPRPELPSHLSEDRHA